MVCSYDENNAERLVSIRLLEKRCGVLGGHPTGRFSRCGRWSVGSVGSIVRFEISSSQIRTLVSSNGTKCVYQIRIVTWLLVSGTELLIRVMSPKYQYRLMLDL